ncbi:MAG: type IV toxin-antitoxin system AbiEi family antitoxin domain-containing protein [Chloroflexi bacterium]|nr:type IV toxin-antitoxin system AbiEi family antitoxin domain-containing protein [Chloroflexota bacterium]
MTRIADQEALRIIERLGVVRPRDLEAHGMPRARIYRMLRKGLVRREGRGLYVAAEHPYTSEYTLAQVAKRVPQAVVCLLSALQFHQITTQVPHEVWIALPEKARIPRLDYPKVRVVRFSEAMLNYGVVDHEIAGVLVRITSPARTVVDCFRYRNKVGLDVAIEALRDAVQSRKAKVDEILRAAEVGRARNVIRPYLEALTS